MTIKVGCSLSIGISMQPMIRTAVKMKNQSNCTREEACGEQIAKLQRSLRLPNQKILHQKKNCPPNQRTKSQNKTATLINHRSLHALILDESSKNLLVPCWLPWAMVHLTT